MALYQQLVTVARGEFDIMNWKMPVIAVGGIAALGSASYGAYTYLGGGTDGPTVQLAQGGAIDKEAIETECGLVNPQQNNANSAASESTTRARVVAGRLIERDDATESLIEAGDCRYRLDGVWTQDLPLSLDRTVGPDIFDGPEGGSLNPNLTHGTYVTPRQLLVEASEDAESLTIRDVSGDEQPLVARAVDDMAMTDVFTPGGERRTYQIAGGAGQDDDGTVYVSVTRSGRTRLRINGENFYRPVPTVSEAADLSSVDAFMIGFNLDNLGASRRGYDVVNQDMFELNLNGKSEVFEAADATEYAIVEKRTVPLGFKLVPEGAEGRIERDSMIRTERQYQETVSWNVGAKVGTNLGKAAENSVGASYSQSNTEGMRSSEARSISTAWQRHKLYALVVDEPFVRLSDAFIDAVEDARRFDRYDELIERFGTHYPHAVTYGSAARMWAEFSENTLDEWSQSSQGIKASAKGAIKGISVSVGGGRYQENIENNSFLASASVKETQMVGGTGSQAAGGTGTPYPILADLRPLHLLLNPLNFPGEEEIYNEVREKLRAAIESYMIENASMLSDKQRQAEREYHIEPWDIRCHKQPGKINLETRISMKGQLQLSMADPARRLSPDTVSLPRWSSWQRAQCKLGKNKPNAYFLANKVDPIIVKGTKEELLAATFSWGGNVIEDGVGDSTLVKSNVGNFTIPLDDLPVGETTYKTYSKKHPKHPMNVLFRARIYRKK